jgi:AraC-like DNA-binding protein
MKILDVVYLHQLKGEHLVRWHSRRHAHPSPQFEFHYFLGGSGTFKNGGRRYPIEKGSLFLSFPDEVHEITADDPDRPLGYYALLFEVSPGDRLWSILGDAPFVASFPVKIGTNHRLFFEEVKNRFNLKDNPSRVEAVELRLVALVLDLWADVKEGQPVSVAGDEPGPSYSIHFDQALGILQNHVNTQISLGELCARLKVTEEHLIRLFKKHLGTSPMKYFNQLKMEAASGLLLNSDLSVKEIAGTLDFSSQQHFGRNFKAWSGQNPTQYRANYFRDNVTGYHMRILETPSE